MPIFVKKHSKPLQPREGRLITVPKLAEEVDDFKNIVLKLDDDKALKFVNGVWMNLKKNQSAESIDDAVKLQKNNQRLEEEKNMLHAKVDILLDLLSESLAEKDSNSKK